MRPAIRPFALLILILFLATGANAQCHIGVYGDAGGVMSFIDASPLVPVSVFVVVFTEDLVNGVAYQLEVDTPSTAYFVHTATYYGPNHTGIGVTVPLGGSPIADPLSVGLGVCVSGFQSAPVVVTEYTFLPIDGFLQSFVYVHPNPTQDPNFPVYSTCQGVVKQCTQSSSLYIGHADPAESTSMSAVKSLYN